MQENVIVNYRIHEKLYESNQSLVYRGYEESTHQPAILKILKDEYPSPEKRARFQREFAITRKLRGNGVVDVFNIEKHQNTLVLLLEDFGGESLDNILKNRTFDLHIFLQLAIRIAAILEHIHQARIIHKDMNPSNIVWNPTTNQLKLIDFGLSSELPRETAQFVNVNSLEGTLAYLSPEQTGRMNRSLDYRTDFYSLGVTLYEMLTGQRPFETHDVLEMIHCHLAKMPVPPCEIPHPNPLPKGEGVFLPSPSRRGAGGEVFQIISDIIMKLLAKNAEDRYQSAFGLRKDLQRCLEALDSNDMIDDVELGQYDMSDRFQIPEKLYGRMQEVNMLLQVFERVREGSSEIMLVTGEPGIGKSSLVYEIHKLITEAQGYFIAGKFDQFQQNIPYHALIQAFQEFVDYLLTEQEDRLALWRETILQAVGKVGKVLTDVFPNLTLVIGPQPEIPHLALTDTQNRFKYVFENFVKAISQKEHPLVLFIDDMQWIDSASLNLLTLLMSNQEIRYFLCIGAYRDNEVSPSHPLIMALDEITQAQAVINTITLPHLAPEHVSRLISDALQCPEKIEGLAGLVYEKTQGNAFFVKQLLHSLYEEGALSFDVENHRWQWDRAAIQQLSITDNVVDLMTAKVRKLRTTVQALLKLAACIGNRFDLETLAVVAEQSIQKTVFTLQYALVEGLVFPIGSASIVAEFNESPTYIEYKFSHDRIQEAAYSLIPEGEKTAVHLNIGSLLYKKISKNQQNERIFDIVNHLNAGRTLIDHPEYILQLAELNLQAGRKAKASTAYQLALRYFTIGTELLSERSWESHYPLMFALHRERYECTYLADHFEEAERLFMPILEHTTSKLEKAEMYTIRIMQYTLLEKYAEALTMGRNVLKLFRIELPEHDAQAAMKQGFEEIRLNLGAKKIADLIHLPMLTDPAQKKIFTLLINLIPPAYQNQPDVFRCIIARMVNMTLKYGITQESSFGFTAYGIILGADSGEYRTGYEFGKLGVQLSETFKNTAQNCKPRNVFGRFMSHWRMPIQFGVLAIKQAFQDGLECGDVLNAGFAFNGLIQALFSKGEHLDRLFAEIEKGLDFSKKTNNNLTFHSCGMWRQFMLNLQGHTRDSRTFSDQDYHESQLLSDMKKNLRQTYLFSILKLHSLYLYEYYTEALSMAKETESILHYLSGELSVAEQNFYYSLTLSALYQTANAEEQRYYRGKLETNQKQMQIWVDNCPENFRHKYLLVEAEIARIEGRNWDAVELYRKAIDDAREQEFIQHEALGNELLAKFWLGQGEEKTARVYMIDANYAYKLWGADGKVQDIEKRYPQLISPPTTTRNSIDIMFDTTDPATSSEGLSDEVLDLATVIKASQAISGEIVLSTLLSGMMQIVLENAGAQRGLLLLPHNGQWLIEAEGDIDHLKATILQSTPIEEQKGENGNAKLSKAIVNYVIHTREALILNNALEQGNFTQDVFIQTHQPKSVLCMPLIYKGKLNGMLYLENNLMTGAFTDHRIQILQMLASQAAISIENARLYDTLEQKVQERTRELKQEVVEREQAEKLASEANQAKSEFLASMSHELRSPMNAILGYAQILHREAQLDEKQRNAVDVIQRSGEHLLMVISDVLDLSKIEARKIEVTLADFNLRRCLGSVADMARMRARQQEIQFKTEFAADLPHYVHGDEKCLRQVLLNLLNNAVKFTKDGEVTFRVRSNRFSDEEGSDKSLTTNLRFEIQDTGIGIPAEHLKQIFLPFHQVNDPAIRHNGTGLGLAISQRLAHLMGGELQVTSVPNQGTTFWFDLEFANAAMSQEPEFPRKIIGYQGKSRTILIADDQEENRNILKDMLLPLGFEIIEAVNGKDALRQLQTCPPDLLLLDLMMPELNGFETIRRIRQWPEFQDLPIISISAHVLAHTQQESLQAGGQDFLAKPIRFETLFEKLQQYLGLEWMYEETAEEKPSANSALQTSPSALLLVPSSDTLELLFQWAMRGDVSHLKEQAKELEISDPALRPFGEKLYQLANSYQIDEIQEFLAQYMEGNHD